LGILVDNQRDVADNQEEAVDNANVLKSNSDVNERNPGINVGPSIQNTFNIVTNACSSAPVTDSDFTFTSTVSVPRLVLHGN